MNNSAIACLANVKQFPEPTHDFVNKLYKPVGLVANAIAVRGVLTAVIIGIVFSTFGACSVFEIVSECRTLNRYGVAVSAVVVPQGGFCAVGRACRTLVFRVAL